MTQTPFPIFKTRIAGHDERYALEDPAERRKYFELKAGEEIRKLKEYLDAGNTFVGFLLGPKNSGKGTYTKLFMEAVGNEHVAHISVGDIVRRVHEDLSDKAKQQELEEFLAQRYRGFVALDKIFDIIEGRDTKTLLPTEVILALVEREIDGLGRKAIFIDGFPRNLDQVSYALYFRALMGYRSDPDFLVFISVPMSVIDERMKFRVVCPVCQVPRNVKLLRTKDVRYDEAAKEFYLLCDNPACSGFGTARLKPKEGDNLGIEMVRERIELDRQVSEKLMELEGVPKVYLRNAIPAAQAKDFVDDYEITPVYRYEYDQAAKEVKFFEEPWTVQDDDGELSYSLLPPAVGVSLIKQTAQALGL